MQLIDTHCHLYLEEFRNDIDAVLQRAEKEGVTRFYLPAIDRLHEEAFLALEARYPDRCRAMMGLHPCYVKENYREELDRAGQLLSERSFAAVGEIGLDYHWDLTHVEQQKDAFRVQVRWSVERGLPVVIHSRKSVQDCIAILKEFPEGSVRGIFHCFSDGLNTARQVMELGFYMGIGGVVTYKNAGLDAVVKELPLEVLVLETDAPYLAPVPFRGKRNESGYLKYVAQKIAEVRGCTLEEVAEVTTKNAQKIFST